MTQIFLTHLILFILSLTILLDYMLLILILFESIRRKSADVFKYKITNFSLSIIYAISYILFFILFLYVLRIYNLGKYLDLKVVYSNLLSVYMILTYIPIVYRIIIIIFIFLSFILFLLLFMKFHKFFIHHIFGLYLYFCYHKTHYTYLSYLNCRINNIGTTNICTHMLYVLSNKYNETLYPENLGNSKMKSFDYSKISKYNFFNLYMKLNGRDKYDKYTTCSPLLFILYDCVFNNFVLITTYYYLLFFTPLMLIKRITSCAFNSASMVTSVLWDIYYSKEKCLYALSKEQKELLDIYMLADSFYYTPKMNNLNLDGASMMLYCSIKFIVINPERNGYFNNNGVHIVLTKEGKAFEEIENVIDNEDDTDYRIEYTLGEEWIIIIDKSKHEQS